MDDQMLLVSPAPHFRRKRDTQSIMLDVVIALMPAVIASVLIFGWRALLIVSVCVVTCVLCEFLFQNKDFKNFMIFLKKAAKNI